MTLSSIYDLETTATSAISRLDPVVVEATIGAAVAQQSVVVAEAPAGEDQAREQAYLDEMIGAQTALMSAVEAGQDFTTVVADVVGLLFELDFTVLQATVGTAQQSQADYVASLEASGPAHPEVVDRYNDAYNELASIQAAKATLDTVIADLGGLDVLLGQVLSSGDPDALGDQEGLDDALEAMLTVGVSS